MPDSPRAAPIFVSHCHEDNAWCRTFVEALRKAGADVWYDEHNLGYGALQEKIERELRARPIFIVILSPTAITKPWVKREMNAAISLKDEDDTRIILPVMAEHCDVPLLWREYKRTSGPGDVGLSASEAAGRVSRALALAPAMAPAAAAPPPATETANQAVARGNSLRAQKRYQEALAAHERAVALEPNNGPAWGNKGAVLLDLKRPQEALAAFERAITLDANVASRWNGKGNALYDLNRPAEALAAYERALALDPNYAFAWGSKGNALHDLGRHDDDLAAYDQVTTLDPNYATAWANKALALRELGREAEAQAAEARTKALVG